MDADFRQALDTFRAQAALTAEEERYFEFRGIDNVRQTLGKIQEEQALRGRLIHMKRIEPFLKTMTEFGKVVEVFLNASEFLAFVWGPLKFLLLITSNFSAAFDSLLDIYQTIGDEIPLLESYRDLFSTQSHMRTLLVKIYETILSIHLMALRYFRQKLWKQLFRSNWKGFTTEIGRLKDDLRRYKHLIENRASLIEFEQVQSMRTFLEGNFQEQRASDTMRRRTAVFQWLSSPDVDAMHEQHVRVRSSHPGTCRWILDNADFKKWFDPVFCTTPLLWINGKPGAGKSVLASLIIEEARKFKDISVAYFYCRFGDPDKDKFLPMARALLSQLLVQDDSLLLFYEHTMSTSGGQGVLSKLDVAQDLLTTALRIRKTYIVLDGIDECEREPRKNICDWFRKVIDSLPHTKKDEIRCLFVSQDDGFARKDLSTLPVITIDPSSNRADITAFSHQWKTRIEDRFGPLKEHGLDLAEIVPARSQGLFIFAKCVLEELDQQTTRDSLLEEWRADTFPSELNQVYERILRRLMKQQSRHRKETIRKLLSWICVCKRPLRWFEIQAAISMDLENETINEQGRRLVDSAKDLCASFVEVQDDKTVLLVHSTVRDFLKSQDIVIESQVEFDLCISSLSYLLFPAFSLRAPSSPPLSQLILSGHCSFYEYAVSFWHSHLKSWLSHGSYDESQLEMLKETLESFLDQHFIDSGTNNKVPSTLQKELVLLEGLDNYTILEQAIVWSKKQLLFEAPSAKLFDFPDVLDRIRSTLEKMIEDGLTTDEEASLELHYGPRWFRCPKMYCRHYYDGFSSKATRDLHLDRHDRPYHCTFDGCHMAILGCVTKKDLENHLLESHGVLPDTDRDVFPRVTKPVSENNMTERHIFQCPRCPKRFTRKFNLQAHERNHWDQRPFCCHICGFALVRLHDQMMHTRRHNSEAEPSEHSSQPTFQCRGDLNTGTQWGCGRSYQREQDFARHLRSEAGKKCILPLRDQVEQEKREESGGMRDSRVVSLGTLTENSSEEIYSTVRISGAMDLDADDRQNT